MAKTQGLSLNPVKISGTCGRLMCCLKYEEEAYEELTVKAPKIDSFVETPAGKGSVIGINLLRGTAKIRLEDGGDTTLKAFKFEELDVLGGKARRAEYQVAKAAGTLEEAGFRPSVIKPAAPLFIPDPLAEIAPATPKLKAPQRSQNQDNRRGNQRGGKKPQSTEKTAKFEPPTERSSAPRPSPARPPAPKPEPVKKPNNRKYYGKKRRGGDSGNRIT